MAGKGNDQWRNCRQYTEILTKSHWNIKEIDRGFNLRAGKHVHPNVFYNHIKIHNRRMGGLGRMAKSFIIWRCTARNNNRNLVWAQLVRKQLFWEESGPETAGRILGWKWRKRVGIWYSRDVCFSQRKMLLAVLLSPQRERAEHQLIRNCRDIDSEHW